MNRPLVLDLSEWCGDVDFKKMKSMNVAAVGIRASWLKEDTRFKEYWAKAKEVGIPRFAYHFRDWRGAGPVQLALFNGLLANDPGELPPALDLEMDPTQYKYTLTPEESTDLMPETRQLIGSDVKPAKYDTSSNLSMSPSQVEGLVWDFLMGMQTAAKRTPMIYSGFFYWLKWMTPTTTWKQFPLWEAWYAPESVIRVPPPWTSWTFWQFTGNGDGPSFGSAGKSMDESWYNGTLAELQAFAGGVPVPPPPVPAPSPYPAYITLNPLNVRSQDSQTSSIVLPVMPAGATVYVDTVSNNYSHFTANKTYPSGGWVWSSYLKKV